MGNEHKLTKAFEIRPSAIDGADRYELLYISEERDNVRSRIISRAGTLADVAALGRALVAFAGGLTVGAALALPEVQDGSNVVEYRHGEWLQLGFHGARRWAGGKWRRESGRLWIAEYVEPARVVSLADADRDPAERGEIGGDRG